MVAVIAHRGASAAAPENTVEAFGLAARLGADAIELDARRTADGAVIVHHDAHLPDGRVIVETAAAALPSSVPSLAEALDACGELIVNIEVKNWPDDPDFDPTEMVAAAAVAEVQRRDPARYLFSSFHLPTMDRVLALDGGLSTAYLLALAEDVTAELDRCIAHGHQTFHPWDLIVTPELVAAAHDRGLAVNTWTVDDPERMAALVAMGIDGIVTNVPDVARSVVDAET